MINTRRQAMKNIKLLLAFFILIFINTSCLIVDVDDSSDEADNSIRGSGTIITQVRTLPEFHAIEMSTAGTVYITYGDTQKVLVTVDDNIMDYIIVSAQNGKLFITTQQHVRLNHFHLVVEVTMTDLTELVTSSAGSIIGKSPFIADEVNLTLISAGDIRLDLTADQLNSKILSAGDLYLSGSAREHAAVLASAGDLHAFNLRTDTTRINLSSAGHAEVTVLRLLDATISSIGSLFYKGNPVIYQRISGPGRLINAN